jgi:hypothetical protein
MRRSSLEWLCFFIAGPDAPVRCVRKQRIEGAADGSSAADAADVPPLGGTCDGLSSSAHSTPSRAGRNKIERANPRQTCDNRRRRSGSLGRWQLFDNHDYLEVQ